MVTRKLEHPIKKGSELVEEISLRPLKARDLRRVKESREFAMVLELAGYLSGQTTQVIDDLEGDDLRWVFDTVTDFLPFSQATGSEPSES